MNLTRREFAKGGLASLGFLMLGDTGLFAAPKEWKPRKAPNLVFGVISDLSIPKSELPPGKTLAITVHPSSCLASKGKPVTAIFNTVTGAVR